MKISIESIKKKKIYGGVTTLKKFIQDRTTQRDMVVLFLLVLAVVTHTVTPACLPLGSNCIDLDLPALEPGQNFPQHDEITRTQPQFSEACKFDISAIPATGFTVGESYDIKITSDIVAPAEDVGTPDGVAMMWGLGAVKGDSRSLVTSIVPQATIQWTAPDLPMVSFYAVCGRLGSTRQVYIAASRLAMNKNRKYNRPPKMCPNAGTSSSGCSYKELGCVIENYRKVGEIQAYGRVRNSPGYNIELPGTLSGTFLNCRNQTIYGRVYITDMPSTITKIDLSMNEITWINPKSWKRFQRVRSWWHSWYYGTGYWKPYFIRELDLSDNFLTNVDTLIVHTEYPTVDIGNKFYSSYEIENHYSDYESTPGSCVSEYSTYYQVGRYQSQVSVDMRGCKATPINSVGQWGLTYLEKLNLANNSISSVPSDMLDVSAYLDNIDLRGNNFEYQLANCELSANGDTLDCAGRLGSEVKSVHFLGIPNVHTLDFRDNQLTEINPATWSRMKKKIRSLYVSGNELLNVTDFTKGLSNLETFKMENNNVASLVFNQFEDNTLLTTLDLSGNPLDFLQSGCAFDVNPGGVEFTSKAHLLNCEGKNIAGAVEFQDVPSLYLKTVNFKNNQITNISIQTFGDSTMLEHVDLSVNKLTHLDKAMLQGSSTKLKVLLLNDNEISSVVDLTSNLTSLLTVRLNNNLIDNIRPCEFESNKQLTMVTLQANPLDWVTAGCAMSDDLTILDCKSRTPKISGDVNFQGIPSCKLEIIDFEDNDIVSLNSSMWYPARSTLRGLYLSRNQLQNVFGLTDGLNSLMRLYITQNPIERMPFRDSFLGHLPYGAIWRLGFSFPDGSKWLEDLNCTKTIEYSDSAEKKACALEYCNAHADLRSNICGGGACVVDVHDIDCEDHWYSFGVREKRIPNLDLCNRRETIDCSSIELYGKVWINDLPQRVTHIDLSTNDITAVDQRTWNTLTAVRSVKINSNDVTNISGVIEGLDELRTLHIQDNKISDLPKDIFQSSTFLSDVNIAGNPLDFLEAGCILSSDAKSLDCSSKSITGTVNFIDVPIVEDMDFSNNEITDINPTNVWDSSYMVLKELRLENNNIGPNIAGYVDKLKNLQVLTLADNDIQELDALAFTKVPKLSQVTLDNNPLDFLQAGCTLNQDASELDCNGKISNPGLKVMFRDLPRATIRSMDFSNNNIVDIDSGMWAPANAQELVALERHRDDGYDYHVRYLEKLFLQSNLLTSLDGFFGLLTELKVLDTYSNTISTPYPTREELVGNNTKLTHAQMGFCYRGGCRYMDLGCQLDEDPPRFLAGTMQDPRPIIGGITPSNPNFVTKGPDVAKLVTSPGKITVTKCGGKTAPQSDLDKCKIPGVMVRSLSDGRVTVLAVDGGSGFIVGDKIKVAIDQWDCEHSDSDKSLRPCIASDFQPGILSLPDIEVTFADDDLEVESLLECSSKVIVGDVFVLDLPYIVQRLRMNSNEITSIDPKSWEHSMTNYEFKCVTEDNRVVGGKRQVHVDEGQDRDARVLEDAEQFTSTRTLGSTCSVVPQCIDCGVWAGTDEFTGELEELWLQNNQLADVTGYTTMLDKLETFKLDNNLITSLDPRQLITLEHLTDVSLLGNTGLDFIENGCTLSPNGRELQCKNLNLNGYVNMQDIPELLLLDFSQNQIISMNPDMWKHSTRSLKTLRLNNNLLTNIISFANNLTSLETLLLNNNRIQTLAPDQFVSNKMLTFLDVSNNNDLDFQAQGCALLTDGTTLDCNNKGLSGFINFTDIPSYTIKRMDFSYNSKCRDHPEYVNQYLCEMTTETKALPAPMPEGYDPPLQPLPQNPVPGKVKYEWIKGITGLGTQMWNPWNLARDGTVEELFLNSNELVNITGYTHGLPNLREFDASVNHIYRLDQFQFRDNSRLDRIGLGFNKLTRLHKEVFRYNPELSSINLLANEIDALSYYQFKWQNQLNVLFLGQNRLKTLELARYKEENIGLMRDSMPGYENLKKIQNTLDTMTCSYVKANEVAKVTSGRECDTWWPANKSHHLPTTGICGSERICNQDIEVSSEVNSIVVTTLMPGTFFEESEKCPVGLKSTGQVTAARLTFWACE